MKDFNSMSDKEIVLQKVWMLFDVLRSDVNTEDYSVVLLFIYLRSENLITQDLLNEREPKHVFIQLLQNAESESIQKVFDVFSPSLDKLSERSLNNIIDLLSSIDSEWLKENLVFVFDETLERISLSQGRRGGEFIQPKQLTEFVNAYVGSTKGLKVFNPFAGVVSFIKDYKDSSFVYAQELNQQTWAIGQLRLIVHNREADFKCEDSIANWPIHEKFDLIVANPPFVMRLNGFYREQYPYFRTAEEFLLNIGLDSLTSSGKLVAVLPQGILFRGGSEQRLRERLITEDFIDTIISFPGGILHHTGIPFIVLVLNKSKELPGKIRLVSADDCISKPSPRENIIEVEKLLSVSQQVENTDAVRIITNDDVIANDFNLNIPRYFQEEIEGVKLKNLLTYFRGSRRDIPDSGKMIRIRDLRDDKMDFKLDVSNVEETEFTRPHLRIIDESCLLLATRWKTLKPTYFEFLNEPIFLNPDILSFKINEQIVDAAYLINELHADYVEEQLTSYRQGAAIPMIRRDDLLEIVIKLPSIEEQRAKVAGANQAFIQAKEAEINYQRELLGLKEETFNEFASIKHTFRQYLSALKSNLSGTRKFIAKKSGSTISLDDFYSKNLNQTLGEHLLSMETTILGLSRLLEQDKSEAVAVGTYKLVKLVKNAHQRFQNDTFVFEEPKVDENSFNNSGIKVPYLDIDEEDFLSLFSNIVSNAIDHGFKGIKGNIIRTELSYNSINKSCVLEISNNGIPMPENFTFQRLITRGEKTTDSKGTGIGGADIKRIVTAYKGEFELINNSKSLFPVVYKISLPISKKNIEDEL